MTPARLRLKRPTGWFAAGQEVAAALEILSGDAFKLYVYLCLNAERQTGRIAGNPDDAVRLFQGTGQSQVAWEELFRQQICLRREAAVEICDRFWPYEKIDAAQAEQDPASYVEQVRQMMGRRACVRVSFSAADERLARNFHAQGVTLAQIERAVWLGCVRKYVALLNGQTPMLITSLHYFSSIVEEVDKTEVGEGYWTHVRHKAEQLERRWVDGRKSRTQKPDEMMETK
jgi:hypothetical protein